MRRARLAWVSGERGRVVAAVSVVVLVSGFVGGRVGGGIVVDYFAFSVCGMLI